MRLYMRGSGSETMTMEAVQQHTAGGGRLLSHARPDMATLNSSVTPVIVRRYNNVDCWFPIEIATAPMESGPCNDDNDYSGPWCILRWQGAGRSWATGDIHIPVSWVERKQIEEILQTQQI